MELCVPSSSTGRRDCCEEVVDVPLVTLAGLVIACEARCRLL